MVICKAAQESQSQVPGAEILTSTCILGQGFCPRPLTVTIGRGAQVGPGVLHILSLQACSDGSPSPAGQGHSPQ